MIKKSMLIIVVILLLSLAGCKTKKENIKDDSNRYEEIKESVRKAVEWNISAQYPGCSIATKYDKSAKNGTYYNSKTLIKNGYIKKEELLDIDGKSYCDIYVKINVKYDDPYDHLHNCETSYKIYLKCNDYEDKGYVDWGL